jgi:hypothetical protein
MEWLANVTIILEAANYFCYHDVICTHKVIANQVQEEQRQILSSSSVRILTPDSREPLDHEFKLRSTHVIVEKHILQTTHHHF